MKWGKQKVSAGAVMVVLAIVVTIPALLYLGATNLDSMGYGEHQIVKYTGVCSENSTVPPCRTSK